MKMLWKEWRQQRLLFLLFCVAGIALPVFEVLESWLRRGKFFTNSGDGIVMGLGAFFAILLSIWTTGSDTRKGVDSFLLSRPIKVYKLFVTKVGVAAVLLFLVFMFVTSLDFVSDFVNKYEINSSWTVISYIWPMAVMFFCVTMFLMVLLRDTAKAVFMAIWFGLLVYFLPLLTGSLEWMNFFEQMSALRNRPSLMKYLIETFSMFFRAADSVVGTNPSASVVVPVYKVTWFGGLWQIVSSDRYLQYLLFVSASGIIAVCSLALAVAAFNRNWRWRPGQRTIVWGIGVSAVFIFSVSMFQAGANIEVVTEYQGKKFTNPAWFGWSYMPGQLEVVLPDGKMLVADHSYFENGSDGKCFKDDLMFRVTCGAEVKDDGKHSLWDEEYKRRFVVQACRFPYAENNSVNKEQGYISNFVVGTIDFFETEPVLKGRTMQRVLGCLIADDRLYICYQPQHKKDKNGKYHSMQLNPIRLVTVDISEPENMRVVTDMVISNSGKYTGDMASYGEYCYINDGAKLILVSVVERDRPKIVKTISHDDITKRAVLSTELRNLTWIPGGRYFEVIDGKLICANAGRVVVLDLSQPMEPVIEYDASFGSDVLSGAIKAVTYRDGFVYLSTDAGVFVLDLGQAENGEYIGERKMTPIEKLAGRDPKQLFFYKDYLAETAWGMGVILYDVSDPRKPKRAFCGQGSGFTSDAGIWNGLLYIQGWGYAMTFLDIAQAE